MKAARKVGDAKKHECTFHRPSQGKLLLIISAAKLEYTA
jgi:hypothetical protein